MEKRAGHASNRTKARLPFYEPPACVAKTSSEIINEARAAISQGPGPGPGTAAHIQPVNTKRPYTPRDSQRTLFGRAVGAGVAAGPGGGGQRPPSSFSLRYLQFQDSLELGDISAAQPVWASHSHLTPMSGSSLELVKDRRGRRSVGSLNELERESPARLPSISRMVDAQDGRRKRRHQFKTSASLGNLPEELEGVDNAMKCHSTEMPPARNAYSSPKEHIERLSDVLEGGGGRSTSSATRNVVMRNDQDLESSRKYDTEKREPDCRVVTSQKKSTEKQHIYSAESFSCPRSSSHATAQKVATPVPSKQTAFMTVDSLFGPNTSTTGVEVDGGVFGEKLHNATSDILHRKLSSDGQGAMYDNHVNEAKLASTTKGTSLDEASNLMSLIQETLSRLNELAINGGADGVVMQYLDALYATLHKMVETRRDSVHSKLKTKVLKCIYRFLERSEDALLLKLARIIFCLPVTGSNLAGACKLVFKVARSDKNDRLFLEENVLDLFVDSLGTASPLDDAEACVYGYGALKFLTMNNQLLSHVLNLGTLDLMVLHLKIVNAAREEGGRLPEQTSHAVFQLTGALRNIAGEEAMFPLLVSQGAVVQLCQSMDLFGADLDLVSNIARTFSIISTNDECCNEIVKFKKCTRIFTKLFTKYPGCQDVVVRLGYALGNLLAKSDQVRLELLNEEGAMDTLLDVLDLYLQKDLQLASQGLSNQPSPKETTNMSLESGSDGSVEDVIVKIIRIIANMSMNKEVGERLTCCPPTSSKELHCFEQKKDISAAASYLNSRDNAVGGRTVEFLLAVLRRKSVAESAELVLSTLSTLNNLTFYPNNTEHSVFHSHLMDLSQALSVLLLNSSEECLVETTKVLGNLTRSKPARDFLIETGGLAQLLRFLQTDNHELLRTTTGVLVNLMADADKREALRLTQGVSRLIALLIYHGAGDWQLASLICQVLWNFCIDMTNLSWLGADHASQLLEILVDFLDDEHLFVNKDNEAGDDSKVLNNARSSELDLLYQQWEDFASIANNLLEKLETQMDSSQHDNDLTLKQLDLNAISVVQVSKKSNPWEEISATNSAF